METPTSAFDKSNMTSNSPSTGDINVAAALRAQYAIETPKWTRRRGKRLTAQEADEPLVDRTAALTLRSKKTERMQKRQHKRTQKGADRPASCSLLDLPIEILFQILSFCDARDALSTARICHSFQDLVEAHEHMLAREIIRRRYWTLHRCFPLPVAFYDVPEDAHAGLLSEKRQALLNIHRKSYHQHIEMVDPLSVCTCMTCVFAWNNLCLIIDLHHWQDHFDNREPITTIPRGSQPEWNQALLTRNANLVRKAMSSPLHYALILQKHLETTTRTLLRSSRWKPKGAKSEKLYSMTNWDIEHGTDEFLDRKGPPSYDFPFHRENYYLLHAYLPNRKWGDDKKWHYYPLQPTQHEKDLEWVKVTSAQPASGEKERKAKALASLQDHNVRWAQYLERTQQI